MEIYDFDIFWNKHFENLKRYAFSLTKKKDLADNLMNDTYVRARDKLHLYKYNNNLIGWLCVIMRNIHQNSFKYEQRYTDYVVCETKRVGSTAMRTSSIRIYSGWLIRCQGICMQCLDYIFKDTNTKKLPKHLTYPPAQ